MVNLEGLTEGMEILSETNESVTLKVDGHIRCRAKYIPSHVGEGVNNDMELMKIVGKTRQTSLTDEIKEAVTFLKENEGESALIWKHTDESELTASNASQRARRLRESGLSAVTRTLKDEGNAPAVFAWYGDLKDGDLPSNVIS